MRNRHRLLCSFLSLLLFGFLLFIAGCQNKPASPFSKTAEDALSTFELPPGFKIELVAAEPLLNDPVDMEIDENGKMYVVEMNGEPFDESGKGSVKVLTDTNGDGVLDKSTVFADSLRMPAGVMRWKKGILVSDAPRVYYFEDTNGDNVADIKVKMLTGFDSTDVETNANNPVFGLDNWIYLGNGGRSSTAIHYPAKAGSPSLADNARGHMVRFRPESNKLEMLSSRTQFGHSFDEWGTHFMAVNDNHIFQEVIGAQYLNRNPGQLVSNAEQSISDHGEAAEVFPITKNPENQLLTDVGIFTSACSITNYLGGAFPDEFNNNTSFVAEPAQNLVHVDHLSKKGTVYSAGRVLNNKEFLASTDPYFRPVNLYVGPDGALYVVDFYRQFVEGPEFMDQEVVKTANLYNGIDKGRIYRISTTNAAAATWMKNMELGKATNEQLVEKLADVNAWWRLNAQRLLLDRNAKDAVPALIRMTQNSPPLGRLHALWTLEGMNQLNAGLIIKALADKEPGVRENAIRIAELHLSRSPELVPALIKLKLDPEVRVRYQLLNTLGFVNTAEANQVRQQLLFKDINDEWVQIAALSAPPSQNNGLLDAVIARFQPSVPAYGSLIQRLSAITATSQQSKIIHELLIKATMPVSAFATAWQASLLKGIGQGLKSRKVMPPELLKDENLLIKSFFNHPSISARDGALHILQIMGLTNGTNVQAAMLKAKGIANNAAYPADQRALAVNFLALQDPGPYASFLQHLITPGQPAPVQLAALKMLSAIPDQTVSVYVIKQWPSLTPELRDEALNTFLVRPFNLSRVRLLLNAIEQGKIEPNSIGWSRSVILMRDIPDSMKVRSRALLTKKDGKRKDVIQQYQSALQLKGDEVQGKAVFVKNCSLCHQRNSTDGNAFGPDLSTVRNWPDEKLVANILDPGISIKLGYELSNVELKNAEVKQGIILSETSAAVTLKYPGGAKNVVAREDIQSITALNISAMPVGLENQITKQQMADLLSFLRSK